MARLAALATLVGCGADRSFSAPPCGTLLADADGYDVTLTAVPSHVHIATLAMLTFRVTRDGAAVDGLLPSASYTHLTSGTTGRIAVKPRGGGEYGGATVLYTAGSYGIGFEFDADERTISRSLPLFVEGH